MTDFPGRETEYSRPPAIDPETGKWLMPQEQTSRRKILITLGVSTAMAVGGAAAFLKWGVGPLANSRPVRTTRRHEDFGPNLGGDWTSPSSPSSATPEGSAGVTARNDRSPNATPNPTPNQAPIPPNGEAKPGDRLPIFRGMLFYRRPGQNELRGLYNPAVVLRHDDNYTVYGATPTNNGLRMVPIEGLVAEGWCGADSGVETARITDADLITPSFDGFVVSTFGDRGVRISTFASSLSGKSLGVDLSPGGLKQFCPISYDYGDIDNRVEVRDNMRRAASLKTPLD